MYVYVRANVGEELYVIRWSCLYKDGGINTFLYIRVGGGILGLVWVCMYMHARVYVYVHGLRREELVMCVYICTYVRGGRMAPFMSG